MPDLATRRSAVLLADDVQKSARDRLTWQAWGQRLSLDAYLTREQQLRAHPWARERMQTWLLVADAEGAVSTGGKANVLASCETFRMDSRAALGGAAAREGSTYAFASVFTAPDLRGRGYASELMRAVVDRLPQQDPSTQAAILFSDVGAPIYERAGGFRAQPAFDRVWESDPTGSAVGLADALFDDRSLAAELAAVAPPKGDDAQFLVWPSAGHLDWHLERERAYASLMQRPRPSACGTRAGTSRIFWAGDLKNGSLAILLLDAHRADEAAALIRTACQIAAEAGLREVRLWETPTDPAGLELLDGMPPGRHSAREGSLPMIAPLARGVAADSWHNVPRALWV